MQQQSCDKQKDAEKGLSGWQKKQSWEDWRGVPAVCRRTPGAVDAMHSSLQSASLDGEQWSDAHSECPHPGQLLPCQTVSALMNRRGNEAITLPLRSVTFPFGRRREIEIEIVLRWHFMWTRNSDPSSEACVKRQGCRMAKCMLRRD